ncbi:MAG: class I SAM-dependent methyltransferase, partial [Desulfobacteraceae bacterium]|nr:class I SAM-dependent methyltransferase [Desulfobacteraceae bacterium]
TQEEYWDNVAEEKKFTTPFQIKLFKKFVPKDAQILDVGCGYGRALNELYLSGFTNLTGIDISGNMIRRGKNLFPHLNLTKHKNNGIPFGDKSFDGVILLAVLTCIISDVEQEKLISEVHRILRNDGIVYINDFLINNDQRNIDRYKKYAPKYDKYGTFELQEGAGVALRHYTKARIDELMSAFKTITFKPVIYTTMNQNKSNGLYYLGKKCIKENT